MADGIITKQCSHCKQIKPISEYHKNKWYKDGYQIFCKSCMRESFKKHNQTEKYKLTRKRYRETCEYIKKLNAYNSLPNTRNILHKYYAKYRKNHPERIVARNKVNGAIRSGKFPCARTQICKYCGKKAEQYHHHKGYAEEHWLDVIPLCRTCHKA